MEDMKANELMIGDWVISNKRGKNEIVKVVSIEGGTNCCWLDADCFSGLVACEDLSPILLTPEILEKNGLQMGENRFDDTNDIPFPSPTKIIIRHDEFLKVDVLHLSLVHHETYIMDGGYMHIKFRYVHELQHALRLIGLKELANNFKV